MVVPTRSLTLALLGLLLLASPAAAQFGAVSSCTRQCLPKDADVNGDVVRTGDEPVLVALYPHFNGIQRAPLNTEIPPAGAADENRGYGLTPAAAIPGGAVNFRSERFVWWSTPGFVDYDETGRAAADHQEHGLMDDVKIHGDTLTLYFYLSAHAVPTMNSASAPVDAGVMPAVAIYAQVETGRISFHPSSTIIARGDTGGDLPTSPTRVNVITLPTTNERVYEFQVNLTVEHDVIPFLHDEIKGGYVVTVIVNQLRTDDWSAEVTQSDWRVRTGELFKPRLIIPVIEPMRTTYAWMNTYNDKVYLRWSFVSDFGSYDVDVNAIDLEVVGPQGPVDDSIVQFNYLKYGFDHDAHFVPVNQTWGLDYAKVRLPDGEYTATGRVTNLQGTYALSQAWTFTVKNNVPQVGEAAASEAGAAVQADPKDAPQAESGGGAPGFEAAFLLAAALVVAARRRFL